MAYRAALTCALFSCILFPSTAMAQSGNRSLNVMARARDILFPLDVAPKPYFLKMILRFSDSDSQLVAVVYSDTEKYWIRRGEIISYELQGVEEGQPSQLISKMLAENPDITAQEIAARLKVKVTRSAIEPEVLYRALDELKAIRISPILADRVPVDDYSEYEFWYDNWQESVHYTLVGPFEDDPQDKLVQWMIKFRAKVPDLLKASPAPKP